MESESNKLDIEIREISSVIEQIARKYERGSIEDKMLRKCTISYLWAKSYHAKEFGEYLKKVPGSD